MFYVELDVVLNPLPNFLDFYILPVNFCVILTSWDYLVGISSVHRPKVKEPQFTPLHLDVLACYNPLVLYYREISFSVTVVNIVQPDPTFSIQLKTIVTGIWGFPNAAFTSPNFTIYHKAYLHCWKYSKTTQWDQFSKFILIHQWNIDILYY